MKPLDPRLLRHARSTRSLIVTSAVVGVLTAAAAVVMAIALADLVTAVAIDRTAPARWAMPVLIVAVLVKALTVWAAEELPRRSAARMVNELRSALLDRVALADRSWTARQRPSALIQLATSGVAGLQNYAAKYLPQLVLCALVPGGLVVFLAFEDWLSALIVVLTLPLIPVFMVLVGLHTRDHAAGQWRALQVLGGHFLDLISGLPTLKVFGRSESQDEGIRKAGNDYRAATMRTLRVAFLSSMVLELIATISVALVAVTIGLRLVHGSLDLRTGLVVLLVAPEAYAALRAVGTHFHASVDGLAAADELFAIVEEPVLDAGSRSVPDDLTMRVDATVHGTAVSFAADRGRSTLLIGPSGSGKTTALTLLAGTRPDVGTVTIGGLPLAEIDAVAWQKTVAFLVQSPHLVAGTLRHNLTSLRPDATDEQLHRALWAAVADEIVDHLPLGWDTVVSEGAPELSHGQRLRIALARTLVADRPVMLLDEPSAALDLATERELVRRLTPLLADRTVVIASHRAAWLTPADRIVEPAVRIQDLAETVAEVRS